jgi:hypothetical protein
MSENKFFLNLEKILKIDQIMVSDQIMVRAHFVAQTIIYKTTSSLVK